MNEFKSSHLTKLNYSSDCRNKKPDQALKGNFDLGIFITKGSFKIGESIQDLEKLVRVSCF